MSRPIPHLALRLARGPADVLAAQALRHRVFVEELGAAGRGPFESDAFDGRSRHLLLLDALRGDAVVGTCRLLMDGPFATEAEFDIAPLRRSGLTLLEVGRTCLDPAYRGGAALHRLWQGIAEVVEARGVGLLFGLASFPGTDPAAHAQALAGLTADHLAPAHLRPRSRAPAILPDVALDRRAALLGTPALIRAYLRMGGRVGQGAFLDRAFNCTDVCLVLETAAVPPLRRALRAR